MHTFIGEVTTVIFDGARIPAGEFQYYPFDSGAALTLYGSWGGRFDSRVAQVSSRKLQLLDFEPAPSGLFRSESGVLFTTAVTRAEGEYELNLRIHNSDLSVDKTVRVGVGPNELYIRNASLDGRRAVLSTNPYVADGLGGFTLVPRTTLLVVDLELQSVLVLDTNAPLTGNVVFMDHANVLFYSAFQENAVYRLDVSSGSAERIADFGPVTSTFSAAQVVKVGGAEVATYTSDSTGTRIIVFGSDGLVVRSGEIEGAYGGMVRSEDNRALCFRRFESGWPNPPTSPIETEAFAIVDSRSLVLTRSDTIRVGGEYSTGATFACKGLN